MFWRHRELVTCEKIQLAKKAYINVNNVVYFEMCLLNCLNVRNKQRDFVWRRTEIL